MAERAGHFSRKSQDCRVPKLTGPVQGLRKIHFQEARDPVGVPDAVVDEFAPVFGQELQPTRFHRVGEPGPEPVPVQAQEVQEEFRVQGVVLGAADAEGFPVTGQGLGIDRVQRQEVIHHQGMDHGAARLFDGDANRAS